MTISRNVALNVLLLIVELAGVAQWALGLGIVPLKYVVVANVLLGCASKATALLAHYLNPDGSPAKLAWVAGFDRIVGIAEAAYESYRRATGGKSLATGQTIPGWASLPAPIQTAWQAAAGAALYKGTQG